MKTIVTIVLTLFMLANSTVIAQKTIESPAMASFMGKEGETTISIKKVRQVVGLLAKPVDPASEVRYIVQKFTITVKTVVNGKETSIAEKSTGSKLPEKMLILIKKVKVGDILVVGNVMVTEKDKPGELIKAKGVKLTVK